MLSTPVEQGLLVVFVAALIVGACSNSDGTSLNIDEFTKTTRVVVDDPFTTIDVDDTTNTTDGGHTHDETSDHTHDLAATYPIVDPEPVECLTEYVHVHPTVLDAHVQSEPANKCHSHTCETVPHGPDVTYSGDPWPCPAPATTTAPTTAAPKVPTSVPSNDAPETTTEALPTSTIDRGTSQDLVSAGDDCPGTIMGRFHLGEPSGCRLDDGTVLCLSAPRNSVGELLYNAAEWIVCPDFDPNRPPCPTSYDAADHGWTDRWDYVLTSAEQGSYVRPLWEGTIDLTSGLWFGELCVRNNEGSQLGIVEPQRAYVQMGPQPYCDGLPGFTTEIGSDGPEDHICTATIGSKGLQTSAHTYSVVWE